MSAAAYFLEVLEQVCAQDCNDSTNSTSPHECDLHVLVVELL